MKIAYNSAYFQTGTLNFTLAQLTPHINVDRQTDRQTYWDRPTDGDIVRLQVFQMVAILDLFSAFLSHSRSTGLHFTKFDWYLCSSCDDMNVWIFCSFGLKMPLQAPKAIWRNETLETSRFPCGTFTSV